MIRIKKLAYAALFYLKGWFIVLGSGLLFLTVVYTIDVAAEYYTGYEILSFVLRSIGKVVFLAITLVGGYFFMKDGVDWAERKVGGRHD